MGTIVKDGTIVYTHIDDIPRGAMEIRLPVPEGYVAEIISDGLIAIRPVESEDEKTRKHIIKILNRLSPSHWDGNEKSKCIAYLEKQKEPKHAPCDLQKAFEDGQESIVTEPEKYGLMKMTEWSEEDENMMNNIIRVLSTFVGTVECESNPSLSSSYPTYLREINWLKSLKNRGNFPKSNTNSPSWSEDDEAHLKWLCRIVHGRRVHGELSLKEESELGNWIDKWLNHNPQPHWKPSEEQMDWLLSAVRLSVDKPRIHGIIVSLYEQLRRLYDSKN